MYYSTLGCTLTKMLRNGSLEHPNKLKLATGSHPNKQGKNSKAKINFTKHSK
jgi:hypothetical protein